MSEQAESAQVDDDDDLDLLTEHEKERLRQQAIRDRNERMDHRRRAAKNRRRGMPEPKVGDFLHVTIARGIHQRNRAGLTFEKNVSSKVEVVDLDGDALMARQMAGERVVSIKGAELILDDDALIARQSPAGEEDILDARATIDAQNLEIARLRAELDVARSGAKKEARRAAAKDNDVAPTRLNAAKAGAAKFDESQKAANLLPTSKFAGEGAPAPMPSSELGDFITPVDKG